MKRRYYYIVIGVAASLVVAAGLVVVFRPDESREQVSGQTCIGAADTPGGSDPWGGCWPSPDNTGIAGCPQMQTHDGDFRPSSGTTVENLIINGQLLINDANASDIVVRCVKVNWDGYFPIDTERDGAVDPDQILFDRVEVDCGGSRITNAAFLVYGATVRNSRVLNCPDAYRYQDNSVIENSYCGDLRVQGDDAQEWHYDCAQTTGASNMTLRHNTFVGKDTSDIAIWPDIEPVKSVLVERNLLLGSPAYKVYVGKGTGSTEDVTVRENLFGRDGGYGPCTIVNASPGWTGNLWSDTKAGLPVSTCV